MKEKEKKYNIIKLGKKNSKNSSKITYPKIFNSTSDFKFTRNKNSLDNFPPLKRSVETYKKFFPSSSTFLERNYDKYLQMILTKKNILNLSKIKVEDLNNILFNLKKNNNEIMKLTSQKSETIKKLRESLKVLEYKFNKLTELQDIELADEKINIKGFNELKASREELEQKLFKLIKEKQEIDYSLKNEQEYNRTIQYMCENEENRLLSIKKESNAIEGKLLNLKNYQKLIDENLQKTKNKDKNFEELNKKISKDMKLIEEVNNKQEGINKKLDIQIIFKEREIQFLEKKAKELKEFKSSDMVDYKNNIEEEIEKAKQDEKKRIDEEKKDIEIIYSLYIIQKYFTEENDFNRDKLISSQDYQFLLKLNPEYKNYFFESQKYNSSNNSKAQFNLNNSFDKTQKDISRFSDNDKTLYNSFMKNNNSKSFKNYGHKLNLNVYFSNTNNLDELREKFNEINLTKETLFDYNSRLISKLNFYRSQMDVYHLKELTLEENRSKYDSKAREIISTNFHLFEDIASKNENFQKFFEQNKDFIKEIKIKNHQKRMDKIIENISKKNEIKEKSQTKNGNKDKQKENDDDILFTSSKEIIMKINNFFVTCSDLIKDIIIYINYIKNYNQNDKKIFNSMEEDIDNIINDEKNKSNVFIDIYKGLLELKKNRDVDISNNYKLLIQYIKTLVQFVQEEDQNSQESIDINEIYNNLLGKFYKNDDNTKPNTIIDKLFVDRFLSKKLPYHNDIFNHFTSMIDQTIKNIKAIYNLVYDESNNKYLESIVKSRNETIPKVSVNKKSSYIENLSGSEYMNSTIFDKSSTGKKQGSSKNLDNKYEELCNDDEDLLSYETEFSKKKVITRKRRLKSSDEKVINQLYSPFLDKTSYLRKLNPNLQGIKQMINNSSKKSFEIKKMMNDVDTISSQMKIYNNPILDPNRLCNNTYNSIIKLMINDNVKRRKAIKTAIIRNEST